MKAQTYQLNANGPERPGVTQRAHDFIDRLPVDKSWVVTVKALVKSRTHPQNAALFGVAYPALTEATGYTPDELHDAFCRRFFGTVKAVVMGEQISRARRTTTTNEQCERDVMPAADFADFYDMVQQVGAECGCDVPSPDPLYYRKDIAA
jgi:hypothetical protein